MKGKAAVLSLFLILTFLSFLSIVSIVQAETPEYLGSSVEYVGPTPQDTSSQIFPIVTWGIFGLAVLILIILLIILLFGKNKIVMWAFIGGLYALIPSLLALIHGDGGGDPGPMIYFILPPFWPALATFFLLLAIVSLPALLGLFNPTHALGMEPFLIANIFFWILIGAGVGWFVKKDHGKALTIFVLVMTIVIPILGYYLFFRKVNFVYLLTFSIFPLAIIYFLIKRLRTRNGKTNSG